MISVGAALPFFFVLYLSTFFLLFFYFSILLSSHLSPIYFYLLHISSLLLYSLSPSFLLFISQLIYLFYRGFFFLSCLDPFLESVSDALIHFSTLYTCVVNHHILSAKWNKIINTFSKMKYLHQNISHVFHVFHCIVIHSDHKHYILCAVVTACKWNDQFFSDAFLFFVLLVFAIINNCNCKIQTNIWYDMIINWNQIKWINEWLIN